MKGSLYIGIALVVILAACKGGKTTPTGQVKSADEDLTKTRPRYMVTPSENKDPKTTVALPEPKADVTKTVKAKQDSIHAFNQGIVTAEGYRILVYNGNSSEESRDVRLQAQQVLPNIHSYIEWRAPSFKVKVGDFIDKLEAYYALSELQKTFPNAILVPDKVNLRSSN